MIKIDLSGYARKMSRERYEVGGDSFVCFGFLDLTYALAFAICLL